MIVSSGVMPSLSIWGINPVYTVHGRVIKNSSRIDHINVVAENKNGFRLPTNMEWELAARYKGSDSSPGAIEYPAGSGNYWTPGNYASGTMADYNNEAATKAVAWYGSGNTTKTQNVGLKPVSGNDLRVFYIYGNIWELCSTQREAERVVCGGSWAFTADNLQSGSVGSVNPGRVSSNIGFRFVRTHL